MQIKPIYKTLNLAFLAILIAVSMCVHATFAIGASPLRATYSALPGEVVKGEIVVINTNNVEGYVVLDKENFEVINEKGEIQTVEDENYAYGMKEWLQFPQNTVYVDPGNAAVVPYEIHIPNTAAPQGYYGLISLQIRSSKPDPNQETGVGLGVGISARISHLILLSVEGDMAKSDTTFDSYEILSETSQEKTIETTVTFSNKGNTHSTLSGALYLLDTDGNPVAVTELNPGENSILPNTTRAFTRVVDVSEIGPGTYNLLLRGKTSENNFFEQQQTIYIDLNQNATKFDYEYPNTTYDFEKLQELRAKELQKLQIEKSENALEFQVQQNQSFIQQNRTIISVISVIAIIICSILIINYTLIAFKK
ncbi:hypothetical protein KKD70_05365 [Patescibacteria group bacterium]|nr:hypothetical protein [Patescibacteria group bacterium]